MISMIHRSSCTELLNRLGNLTASMSVPCYRRKSVVWLLRNMGVKNKEHPNFPKAIEILEELSRRGVR